MGRVDGMFSVYANVPVSAQYRQADGTGTDWAITGTVQVWFDEDDHIVKVEERFKGMNDLQ